VVLGWSSHAGIDLGQWPNLKRFHERVGARPSVTAALRGEGLIK
jgi:glutathione S-transferase